MNDLIKQFDSIIQLGDIELLKWFTRGLLNEMLKLEDDNRKLKIIADSQHE
jgi:hypothetical protein